MNRIANLKHIANSHFDVMIVGGGNSGASIAACLSHTLNSSSESKGTLALIDRSDFASGTSQHSSNLIWGGIKYLENGELSLVRKLCLSRNKLIEKFPGLVEEIRFYCPHECTGKHSLLKLILGTWFYWLWGNFFTQKPKRYPISSLRYPGAIPAKPNNLDGIFEYSDAYLPENDARFVFHFIQQAHKQGATIANYVEFKKAIFHPSAISPNSTLLNSKKSITGAKGYWELELYDRIKKRRINTTATILINATGGYVDSINQQNHISTEHIHCFSKGVHIIVKKLFKPQKVLTFFSNDDRLFFAIPMGPCTCIGTTDTMVDKPEADISDDDIKFILTNINRLLKLDNPLTKKDIISTRSGVRPLVIKRPKSTIKANINKKDKWFTLSRKHVIEQNEKNYLSIFGGKLTDCINIAEEARERVCAKLEKKPVVTKANYHSEWIPNLREIQKQFMSMFQELVFSELNRSINTPKITKSTKNQTNQAIPTKTAITELAQFWGERLWRRYGQEAFKVVEEIKRVKPFLKEFIAGSEFCEGEIRYQLKNEMVMCKEDLLRRRSMLALVVKEEVLKKNLLLKKLSNKIN